MESPTVHAFVKLPFEVSFQILAELDNRSLKALRLAFVNPRVSAAAAKFLFGSVLKLRLGTPQCRFTRIRALLNCFEKPGSSSWVESLQSLKSLVVDTRFPFIATEEDLRQSKEFSGDKVPKLDCNFASKEDAREWLIKHMVMASYEDQNDFVRLISRILASAKNLQTVKWTSGSLTPMNLHWDLSRLLSDKAAIMQYKLEVTLNFDWTVAEGFLEPLANLSSFALVEQHAVRQGSRLPAAVADDIVGVLARSKQLTTCKINIMSRQIRPRSLSILQKAIREAESLQFLHLGFYDNLENSMDWSEMKRLNVTVELRYPQNDFGRPPTLTSVLPPAANQVAGLLTGAYCARIRQFQMVQNTYLTHVVMGNIREDIWPSDTEAVPFWTDVVKGHSKTLKSVRLLGRDMYNTPWSWNTRPGNLARSALETCTQLEHVQVKFDSSTEEFIKAVTMEPQPKTPARNTSVPDNLTPVPNTSPYTSLIPLEKVRLLLDTRDFSDVILTVGKDGEQKSFALHRIILASHSSFLKEVLAANDKEVFLPTITADAFTYLLDWFYEMKLPTGYANWKIVVDLFEAATFLKVNPMRKHVMVAVKNALSYWHEITHSDATAGSFISVEAATNILMHLDSISRSCTAEERLDLRSNIICQRLLQAMSSKDFLTVWNKHGESLHEPLKICIWEFLDRCSFEPRR
ncbi:hypothetical protein Dda_9239 [Drechslerella dactyloides]|uniref:BTB domain-containing protein n=1 Tax=Drechslerella dactyloides TaxID=74499 RepID=A0AAD6IPE8_DREDA|nr:hypothetical protein Dda_9239 [Drechslerella dactyloides]